MNDQREPDRQRQPAQARLYDEPGQDGTEQCRSRADLFDTELLLRAERAGLVIEELPIDVRELRPARTSIWRRALRTIGGLVRLRLALWRERRG